MHRIGTETLDCGPRLVAWGMADEACDRDSSALSGMAGLSGIATTLR